MTPEHVNNWFRKLDKRLDSIIISAEQENAIRRDEHMKECIVCCTRGKPGLDGELNDGYCSRWEELK